MSENITFGEYLKTVRLSKRLTLSKAARRMGMSPQKLSDIESGRRYQKRISLNLVTTLAKAYDISIAEIIRNTETTVHTERTTSEILAEAIPLARMCELLSQKVLDDSKTFTQEHEQVALELHTRIKDIRALLSAMRKKTLNTSHESTLDPVTEDSYG